MQRPGGFALAAIAGAALLLLTSSKAPTVYADGTTEIPVGDPPSPLGGILDAFSTPTLDSGVWGDAPVSDASPDANSAVDAFLYAIIASENSAEDAATDDAYYTFYGGSKFYDLSDHPLITGEKVGVPLPSNVCINAGIASGNCVSTAAGAFQINLPTWNEIRSLGGETLPDFSILSQNEAARRLLVKTGAMNAILAGDIPRAIQLAGKRWASLPGALGKQGQRTPDYVIGKYNEYLENYA